MLSLVTVLAFATIVVVKGQGLTQTEAANFTVPTKDCVDDCHGRPNGFYRSCVNCHKVATCIHNKLVQQPTCRYDWYWDDHHKVCTPYKKSACEAYNQSVCRCSGDTHCLSFDARWLNFQGKCEYISSRDGCKNGIPYRPPTFVVTVKFRSAGKLSFADAISISIHNNVIIIGQKKRVTVNGHLISKLPYFVGKDAIIYERASFVEVSTASGVQIDFDGDSTTEVFIPNSLQGKVCGFCGNNNGNPDDDWIVGECLKDKTTVVPGSLTDDSTVFGDSWLQTPSIIGNLDSKCNETCALKTTPSPKKVTTSTHPSTHPSSLTSTQSTLASTVTASTETTATSATQSTVTPVIQKTETQSSVTPVIKTTVTLVTQTTETQKTLTPSTQTTVTSVTQGTATPTVQSTETQTTRTQTTVTATPVTQVKETQTTVTSVISTTETQLTQTTTIQGTQTTVTPVTQTQTSVTPVTQTQTSVTPVEKSTVTQTTLTTVTPREQTTVTSSTLPQETQTTVSSVTPQTLTPVSQTVTSATQTTTMTPMTTVVPTSVTPTTQSTVSSTKSNKEIVTNATVALTSTPTITPRTTSQVLFSDHQPNTTSLPTTTSPTKSTQASTTLSTRQTTTKLTTRHTSATPSKKTTHVTPTKKTKTTTAHPFPQWKTCFCHGDPHCTTFNQLKFDFMGSCSYTMVRDKCYDGLPVGSPTIQVYSKFQRNVPKVEASFAHSVDIYNYKYNENVTLGKSKRVTLNGQPISVLTPYTTPSGLIIRISGSFVKATTPLNITVGFDGIDWVSVDLPASLFGKVCGLCGSGNGNKTADKKVGPSKECLPTKTPPITGSLTTNYNILGWSWLYGMDQNDSVCRNDCHNMTLPQSLTREFTGPGPIPPAAVDACSLLANNISSDIKSQDCLNAVGTDNIDGLLSSCQFDVTVIGLQNSTEIVCSYSRVLAKMCLDEYNIVYTLPKMCTVQCHKNEEYLNCGPALEATCAHVKVDSALLQNQPCSAGCYCKAGYLRDAGNNCVLPKDCGCYSNNTWIAPGTSFLLPDCSSNCICNPTTIELECSPYVCPYHLNATCDHSGTISPNVTCLCPTMSPPIDGTCQAPKTCNYNCTAPHGVTDPKFFFRDCTDCRYFDSCLGGKLLRRLCSQFHPGYPYFDNVRKACVQSNKLCLN